jgi:hypothetical protein
MLSNLKGFAERRPKLAAWIALAIGMVIILIIAARDVGLQWNQWLFLILATIGLAGLCVWIIGWESGGDAAEETKAGTAPTPKPSNRSPAETQALAQSEEAMPVGK